MCGGAPIQASLGKIVGHRLNWCGHRQANSAFYPIVLNRMANHQPTGTYVECRRAEGGSTSEIIPALKRHVAREVYRHLSHPA